MIDLTYVIIFAAVLIISPFVLRIASSQKKETKQQLKLIFLGLLCAQILLGFFVGSKLFPAVSFIQILLLLSGKSFNTLVVILNFINSVLIFVEMIRLSDNLGYQVVSLPAVAAVFLVLIGNVFGLAYINKDANLLKKYFR
ncbi:hypothetical protein HYW42_03900 [Candidatus Daviesbacteria bacterium]|nr:hypothetical protein [Candidatus Daviesbacteria bacterium]